MADKLIDYLRLVSDEENGCWINVHHLWQGTMPGSAHQRFRTAILDVEYWTKQGYDTYIAQSLYVSSDAPRGRSPYHRAIRKENNLTLCRALYMDIDVKEEAYGTKEEARAALDSFIEKAQLPPLSCLVSSGSGGMHAYWAMAELFEPSEFRKRAAQLINAARENGLLFDPQCTIDPVRLLRPPGTWNFKGTLNEKGEQIKMPAPVEMLVCGKHIDNAIMWGALDKFSDIHSHTHTRKSNGSGSKINDELADGMGGTFTPVDIATVACPMIKDTLADSGRSLRGDPQWHMVVNLASFCVNPRETAHLLCKGNEHYTVEGTDAKIDSVELQKAGRTDIGPFKCEAVALLGMPQCVSCKFRAQGTTPLNIHLNGHAYLHKARANDIDLPDGYYRGALDQFIYKNTTAKEDDDTSEDIPVFPYQIIPGSGYMEDTSSSKFFFETVQGDSNVVIKSFNCSVARDRTSFHSAMLERAMPLPRNVEGARTFMLTYLEKLKSSDLTLSSLPAFGWSMGKDNVMGFAFNGKFISPAGEQRCLRPDEAAKEFRAVGEMAPWQALAKIVITKDRPDLAVMAATGFGAALVNLSGHHGVLMGLWSSQSGIGKTTAMMLGQAIWGNPTLGGYIDTISYTFAKCATLRHLPVYFDEIKGDKQVAGMGDIAIQLTGGGEKGRSNPKGEMREKRTFHTGVIYASNGSILSEVRSSSRGSDATMLRMFEMRALDNANSEATFVSVQRMVAELAYNYGKVGEVYAKVLGNSYDDIKVRLERLTNQIQTILKAPQDHRFWLTAMATTLLGAHLATEIGFCTFPLNEMWDFMRTEYRHLADEIVINPNDYSKPAAVAITINTFLNEKQQKNMVILDKTWTQKYRPPRDYAKVLNDRSEGTWGTLEVQVSGDPLQLRISDEALGEWCQRTQRPKGALIAGMKKHCHARMSAAVIGSGSKKAGSAINCWIIDAKGTPLEETVEYTIQNKMVPPDPLNIKAA